MLLMLLLLLLLLLLVVLLLLLLPLLLLLLLLLSLLLAQSLPWRPSDKIELTRAQLESSHSLSSGAGSLLVRLSARYEAAPCACVCCSLRTRTPRQ